VTYQRRVRPTGGLSISINSSTGAYTITGLSSDQGTATLRATYGGVSYDKIYTLTKQKQGATGTAGSNGTNGTNGAFDLHALQSRQYDRGPQFDHLDRR
jgi:hypothetical protein